MSDGSAHGLLEMPCLGRPFQLGMLYDCCNDGLIPGVTLWGPDTLGTAKHAMMKGSDFEIITEDSFNQKTLHLDVSAGLKLSVLGGLVKAGGSGKFLYDRTTSKSQARVSLRYKSTSRFEQLNMSQLGKFEYPRVFEDDIATHVVTGVQYGADAVFVFDRQVDSTEKFYQVHGNLEAMISVLPSIDFQVGGSANLDLQKRGNEGIEKIQCKFYGDFILHKNPTTYQEAVRVYQELPKLLGGAGCPNSVPKKVWPYPLSKLDSKVQRMVREISSYLIDDVQEIMESLHEQEVRINDLIKSEACSCFDGIKADLVKLRRFVGAYKVTVMKTLSTLLPKVRGGGEEEAKLAEFLEMNCKSPFSCEKFLSWIKEKEKEVAILTVYLTELKKHGIQFAFESNEIVTLTSGLSVDNVLCFDFNIPAGNDSQIQRMENYLHGRRVEQELQLKNSWYESQELRQQLQRFVEFVKRNCKDSACKYVVTNGYDSVSSKLGVMLVFVDAYKTVFDPPDQPGVPRASSKTHNSLQLSWDKPKYGSDNVQSYTVSYRSVDDPPDQWSTQTSSEECLVLTKLTPGSLYHFKVTAESAVGSSPESEVGEERLPPDQPGKPEIIKKTHNSLQLKWTKPEHGASLVSLYTVHCCSENGPPDQWNTKTSSEECLVLTNLTPGSLYHFKVTAESPVGPSPESELGEERLPPDQPGIPQVTQKTHKSIQLKWEKPEYGAHFVQCYAFFYRSDKEIEKWQTQYTNKPNISLGEMAPGTLYYFKVKAQSVAGSSPFSEESEERLPPDQPGKPTTTKKTHNSLQLKWSKPEHGATIVSSYDVHYCSMDDPPDQWRRQTSSEECVVLTKLTPGSLYKIKVTAVSAVGSSPASEVCEITLPPDQPGKPQVFEKTYNSIHLKWEKPKYGTYIVQSYVFFYCSENETDKWLSKATNKESISLNGITPGIMYFFKVTAQSAADSSPESEVGEIRLPPEHPGKPHAANKTHNNLQLKWTKPKHGAGIVSSYTVSYCSLNDQANKWCMKTVKEECLVLTKLTPGLLYHFKVTAESTVGSSPASEVGEARLPPDQPGKPNGSYATCNSIQLKWNQPKHGAEIVQCYTISYQSVSTRCETLKTTSKHECVKVSNLASKTVYTFKVRAESAAGPGPESELSDPIETMSPSLDKSQVSNITHNSVKLSWKNPSECVLLYTVLYCIVDDHSLTDPAVQWHSRAVSNSSCSVYLDGLLPGTKYVFKVRGEVYEGASPVSEFSNNVKTLLAPPGKPYATNIGYKSFQLNWNKPNYDGILYYSISYRSEDDPTNKWSTLITKNYDNKHTFIAAPEKIYFFKISSVTNAGYSSDSEVSGPFMTTLGSRLLSSCMLISENNPRMYQLPLHYAMKRNNIIKAGILQSTRFSSNPPEHKVLLLVGATGAGKSTLINAMANYIMGVDWEDEYRFKLISEETAHDQTKSQTKCITAYTFHKGRGSPLPYTLTVIDTPGFGDTGGLERDKQIVSQIKELFSIPGDEGIYQLHGIGFVTQAHLTRLTPTQQYIFYSIHSVFGKDVADNIFLMVTFVDGKHPLVIDAARAAGVPFKNYFKFNNSALFVSNRTNDVFNWMFWRMGKNSFEDFFNNLSKAKTQSFQLSSELSEPIVTKIKPLGFALLSSCKTIFSEKGTYQLLLRTTMKKNDITKVVVGNYPFEQFLSVTAVQHKVLMVVGATGAGKSTLINAMANYIMGVDWKDEYRFKLISEETAHDQTKSQTKCITAYTFHKGRGSPLPYTLTVIDTPGFGDTGGLMERDKQIVKQIKEFISIRGDEGIDQLHGIGFVTQAPLARLTPTQRYVFDSILSVFGKDVADNIFLMVTFADGKQPPVLDAARAAGVPFSSYFKFNNSALFASNQTNDVYDWMFWRMGKNSFKNFFHQFSRAPTRSLQQSREVLQQRERLELTIQGLLPQIRAGLAKIDELRQERQLQKNHEELKSKYDSAMTDKGQAEAVMTKMKDELKEMDRAVLQKIKQAKLYLQRLKEIALSPGRLTVVEYIDNLIESEQREARPGYRQRVKVLHEVRKQAAIVSDIQSAKGESNEYFFPRSADEFPCNQPEQQELGMWGKFKSLWDESGIK